MGFNFNNADRFIEKKNDMYSEKYDILYSIYDRACGYDYEDYEKFNISPIEMNTIDFWLDYIISPIKYLDPYTSSRIILQMKEIMIAIHQDPTSIEFKLKYKPKNWILYLDQYGNYIRYPDKIERKPLFKSKEEILHDNGF